MRKRESKVASISVPVDGESFDGLEPWNVAWINSSVKCNGLPESKGWRGYRWIITEPSKDGASCGRTLVSKVGNLKRADLSIAKFSKGTREVGGAHSTHDCSVNKSPNRKGALL